MLWLQRKTEETGVGRIFLRLTRHFSTVEGAICSGCHDNVSYTGWLKQQKFIFSQSRSLEIHNQGVGRTDFSWGLFPWPPSRCVLTWPDLWAGPSLLSLFCLQGHCSCWFRLPTLKTLFNLNYLFKGSISKYSHILRCSGLELQL